MIVEDYNWRAWGELLHGVRTGEVPFHHVHGQPAFPWLREHPEHERVFAGAMASLSGTENPAVARAYDFGALGTLVDVGGAHGHLLATILRRHRHLRGILFDQPQVVEAAARSDFLAGAGDRCEVRGGSFFDGVPPGAGGYLMKYIIHDWDDERALGILRHCRQAMAPEGRVLLVEHVLRPSNTRDFGKLLDINMLVLAGGPGTDTRGVPRPPCARRTAAAAGRADGESAQRSGGRGGVRTRSRHATARARSSRMRRNSSTVA
jgi:hypothetical protein